MSKLKGWKEIPAGGVIPEPGTSASYHTGSWRTFRPLWKSENCIHCLFCYMFCPDSAIIVEEGKVTGIDYRYCKGCGICARECPSKVKAIEMAEESQCEP